MRSTDSDRSAAPARPDATKSAAPGSDTARGVATEPDVAADPAVVSAAAAAVMEAVPLTMRAIRREMRAGRDPSLSVPQFRALLFLRREPDSGLGAAAEHLGITAGAASELIERLVRQGLVDRDADPRERRRIRLRLTERGAGQLLAAEKQTRSWISSVLACLDERQLDRLTDALADLRGAIEGATPPPAEGPDAGS